MERTNRSQWAFKFGLRGGKRSGSTPLSLSTASNACVNFVSRSWSRYRLPSRKPSNGSVNCRAHCCMKAAVGWGVMPATCTRRVASSMTTSTYEFIPLSFWYDALQVVQGRLFGMLQGKANQWIHVLLPALLAALRALGDAPARSLTALAQRLGVAEADAATVVVPLEEAPAPLAAVPASPLLPMMGRNGGSSAPKILLHRPTVIAGRKRTIRSKMSCS